VVTAKRDKAAALKLLKRIVKKYGPPRTVVTDGLRAHSAAMSEVGNADRQEVGRSLNNRVENSHQPFRRRERAMQRFRSMNTLQKFGSVRKAAVSLTTPRGTSYTCSVSKRKPVLSCSSTSRESATAALRASPRCASNPAIDRLSVRLPVWLGSDRRSSS
jgi:transposase-like protein